MFIFPFCFQVPWFFRHVQHAHPDLEGRVAQRGPFLDLRRNRLSRIHILRMGRPRALPLQIQDPRINKRMSFFTHQW